MGAEARCTAHFRGRASKGTALLETEELLFRGAFRLAIPFREIRKVGAADGKLSVTFAGGRAVFDLGPKAEVWAEKIRSPKGLLDKLGVKPGTTAVVSNVADPGFRADLAARGVKVSSRPATGAGLIFLGVESKRDLARLRTLAGLLRPDGAIWLVAPRGSAAVREADVLASGKPAGLVDVKVVRFSETHTAHKFVIPLAKRPKG